MALAWTQDEESQNWTLSGTIPYARTALIFSDNLTQNSELELGLADREQKVAAFIPGSGDGRTGYRVGVDTSDTTKITIREVVNGVVGAVIASGADDIPVSATLSASHGVATATPFKLRVRVFNGWTEVRIDTDDTPIIRWTTAGQATYGALRRFGFESDQADALVLRPRVYPLVNRAPVSQAEVLLVVCDGRMWFSVNGNGIEQIDDPLLFNTSGLVALTEYNGVVKGVDGKNRLSIDLTQDPPDVDVWTATAGQFPGTGADPDGDTEMSYLCSWLGRVATGGSVSDAQNFYLSAVGDADDWDTAADEPGEAFASGTGLPNKIGEPITCLYPLTRDVLLIGCLRSVWRMIGDPALGIPEITPVIRGIGITTQNAVTLVSEGLALSHGPDGVLLIPAFGEAIELSKPVLSEGIQLPRESVKDYLVSVARDALRHLVYIFLTPKDASQGTHFVYDERVGNFTRGEGGFFPDDLPAEIGPTCAVSYMGRVLLGTWDGSIVAFDEETTDDAGTDIESRFALSLIDEVELDKDTILLSLRVAPAQSSDDFTATVYGGRTAEEAFVGDNRWTLFEVEVDADDPAKAIRRTVRAPAMVLEFSTDGTDGQRMAVEEVQIERRLGPLLTRRGRRTPVYGSIGAPPPDNSQATGPGESDVFEIPFNIVHYMELTIAMESGDVEGWSEHESLERLAADREGGEVGNHGTPTSSGAVVPL